VRVRTYASVSRWGKSRIRRCPRSARVTEPDGTFNVHVSPPVRSFFFLSINNAKSYLCFRIADCRTCAFANFIIPYNSYIVTHTNFAGNKERDFVQGRGISRNLRLLLKRGLTSKCLLVILHDLSRFTWNKFSQTRIRPPRIDAILIYSEIEPRDIGDCSPKLSARHGSWNRCWSQSTVSEGTAKQRLIPRLLAIENFRSSSARQQFVPVDIEWLKFIAHILRIPSIWISYLNKFFSQILL